MRFVEALSTPLEVRALFIVGSVGDCADRGIMKPKSGSRKRNDVANDIRVDVVLYNMNVQ